jgi:hypothetical protein
MDSEHYKKALNSAYNRVHNHWPRLQIMIILGLTGVAAFLTSAVRPRLGVTPAPGELIIALNKAVSL